MAAANVEVGVYEAKTNLSELLKRAQAGERITITVHGEPVADLVPSMADRRVLAWAAMQAMRDTLKQQTILVSDEELQEDRAWGRR